MEPALLSRCSCRIEDEVILFCPLHAQAESLLEICEYLHKFLTTAKLARHEDQNLVRELILPYLGNAISAATKKIN
jgi:hypothetical protein